MAGFDFGAFAGGIGSGLEQGVDLKERYRKLADEARSRSIEGMAAGIQGATLNAPDPAGGAAPGSTPPPPPGLQSVAMPGAQPMAPPGAPPGGAPPMTGAGPPGPPPPAPGMQPQQQAGPPPAAPPGAQPMPGPGAPPPQASPAGAPPPGGPTTPSTPQHMPGGMGQPDPQQQMMQQLAQARQEQHDKLKAMWQAAVKLGGPAAQKDPGMVFEAVNQVIAQDTALDASDRNILTAENRLLMDQLNLAKMYQSGTLGQERVDATNTATGERATAAAQTSSDRQRGQDLSHEDRQAGIKAGLQRTAMTVSSAERRTAMQDATRLQAEAIIQAGANGRTQEVVDQRQAALEAGLNEKEWQTEITAQLKEQGMSDTFIASLFRSQASAAAQSGQEAPSAPAAATERPLPAPPARGGGAATAGTQQNPARPRSREEAAKLPKGTWFMDPSGNVIQKH